MRKETGTIIYSPSDLIRYLASPYASWLDRYYVENPGAITRDEDTEEDKLLQRTGDAHEQLVLKGYKAAGTGLIEIRKDDQKFDGAHAATLEAIQNKAAIIYQAALRDGNFAGYADFLKLDTSGKYQAWDTKLALSPKPYYPIQLCCYSEMLAAATGQGMPDRIGVILGDGTEIEFRIEDFIHYYRHIKDSFLAMQAGFSGKMDDCPEPLPRAEHGRWTSHAEKFFLDHDHLVQVAGISVGQIKKLTLAGISTMTALAGASGQSVHKLASDTLGKLVSQARLQCQTREDRKSDPEAKPRYEVLPQKGSNGEPVGFAALPPADPADVFFDMEGYPLVPGGLEYLFGTWAKNLETEKFEFRDWWAHDRQQEKVAFENFVDWIHARWKKNPAMHIYHYAAYEVSALGRLSGRLRVGQDDIDAARRLSTRHDTRQDEIDDLLRNDAFVDLYQIVRHGLRVGEDSYSIKSIETLYRAKRETNVATAGESIVQYAAWMASGQQGDWQSSDILRGIRDYNEDDCKSNAELCDWLRNLAKEQGITCIPVRAESEEPPKPAAPEIAARQELAAKLRAQGDPVSIVLGDVLDFHRRENKPMWWKMFERAKATADALRDDSACVEGIRAIGDRVAEKKSLLQNYRFDPSQECKLEADGKTAVMFTFDLKTKFKIAAIDLDVGEITLKISKKKLDENCQGRFPESGSLIKYEFIDPGEIPGALFDIASQQLSDNLYAPVKSLLKRSAPANPLQEDNESPLDAALRIINSMSGGCLVIQGPPGTGKTYTASCMIGALLSAGKRVGVASNSHKAIVNLLSACGDAARRKGRKLLGVKVGDQPDEALHAANPGLAHIKNNPDGRVTYTGGVVAGTAWLFSRPEWRDELDFLFIDEAGQVSLANAVAMAGCADNLVLLGDQMQLEQPIQGSHPGDAGLSALQYALKDTAKSVEDAPVFHAVVPADVGLFLGESRRMHPDVCRFISESIYEGRLSSIPECAKQKIATVLGSAGASPVSFGASPNELLIRVESGIVFSGIEHDGDIQQSDEEVDLVKAVYNELLSRSFTDKNGKTKALELSDFLFIAPYNAQVRALIAALPKGARVGSVDKFQGQEAAVCILSLCSSYGEYGSRGLKFILDRSRINVGISRAKCLAIVVADPRIANSAAGSIDEMTMLNLFCKLKISINDGYLS
jgi:predicted RecB family nuclease